MIYPSNQSQVEAKTFELNVVVLLRQKATPLRQIIAFLNSWNPQERSYEKRKRIVRNGKEQDEGDEDFMHFHCRYRYTKWTQTNKLVQN